MTALLSEPPVVVALPLDALVVLAGLPGAGKTTLLRRLASRPDVLALDSEDVAASLRRLPVPYRMLRPVVHLLHLLRVLRALTRRGCVLTTDPLTSPVRRGVLRVAARMSGRRLLVVLVDATQVEARDGQLLRARRLSERRMRRHVRRYGRLVASLREDDRVLTRTAAAYVR